MSKDIYIYILDDFRFKILFQIHDVEWRLKYEFEIKFTKTYKFKPFGFK